MSKQRREDRQQPLEGERKEAYRKLRSRLWGALVVLQGSPERDGLGAVKLCHPFIPDSQYRVEGLAIDQLLLVLTSLIKAVPRAAFDEIVADSEGLLCETRLALPYGGEEECKEMQARARATRERHRAIHQARCNG